MNVVRCLSKVAIAVSIAGVLLSIIFAIFFMREPVGGTDVSSPLEVFPVSTVTGEPGILLLRLGQEVTAIYTVTNSTNDISVSRRIGISAAGPHACNLDWSEPAHGFGAIDNIALHPNESKRFTGSQTYTVRGLYFMETNRQTMDNRWGGFGDRVNRQYFIVGDADTIRSVDKSCVAERTRVVGQQVLWMLPLQLTAKP